jgi:hypothetical protein
MNTKILAHPSVRPIIMGVMAAALAMSAFFATAPQAHAYSTLTEPQIQAILGLLRAFDVPAATILNVDNILHNRI